MAFDIHDAKGFVAGGPSIGGLQNLRADLKSISKAAYPQLEALLTYGYATNPQRLKFEVQALSKQCPTDTVKQTLLEIGAAASKAKEIVILHNHVS